MSTASSEVIKEATQNNIDVVTVLALIVALITLVGSAAMPWLYARFRNLETKVRYTSEKLHLQNERTLVCEEFEKYLFDSLKSGSDPYIERKLKQCKNILKDESLDEAQVISELKKYAFLLASAKSQNNAGRRVVSDRYRLDVVLDHLASGGEKQIVEALNHLRELILCEDSDWLKRLKTYLLLVMQYDRSKHKSKSDLIVDFINEKIKNVAVDIKYHNIKLQSDFVQLSYGTVFLALFYYFVGTVLLALVYKFLL